MLNPCGLDKGTINYLRKISLYGMDNRYSDYFQTEVVNSTICKNIQIDVLRDKSNPDKIVVVKLGVNFKVYKIEPYLIYSVIDEILKESNHGATKQKSYPSS
jgi:hypothetical protein